MKRLFALLGTSVAWMCGHADPMPGTGPAISRETHPFLVEVPGGTNALQFRLFNAASGRPHPPCNSFEIEAFGEVLIRFPVVDYKNTSESGTNDQPPIHSLLVNGSGPKPDSAPLRVAERASGSGWSYVGVDLTDVYASALKRYLRGILFIEPDLFILADQIIAKEPAVFQAFLVVPSKTLVDPVWGDLRLETEHVGFRINSPPPRNKIRSWQPAPNNVRIQGNAVLMELPATAPLTSWRMLTVFELHRAGTEKEMAFRLLEAPGAFGARIHRDGYPTLVAFKIDPEAPKASLTGFRFDGPVGVDVFRPPARKVGAPAKQ